MDLYFTPNETVPRDLSNLGYFTILERDITIYPNPNGTNINLNATDPRDGITSLSDPGSKGLDGLVSRVGWIRLENSSLEHLITSTTGPNIWIPADRLAKSFESTILTDLGQITTRPNVLIDERLLQNFTSDFSDIFQKWDEVGPAQADYNSLKASTGPLQVNPSVLATNYLC